MPLNESKVNMYPWVTHTWNPVKGKCPHDCNFCYMKQFPQGILRLVESELKTDLGRRNKIFIGSSCDIFADAIPRDWILRVLEHCAASPDNTYIFQSKNPKRIIGFLHNFFDPRNVMLGTTIETNRDTGNLMCPIPERVSAMNILKKDFGCKIFVSIEPVMDFDTVEFVNMMNFIKPDFVSIGADSKEHRLQEPSPEKVEELILELRKITEVKIKDNLSRITTKNINIKGDDTKK